jgi:hypothetical protein
MISNLVVGNAIEWWDKYGVVPATPISIWRK